MIDAIYAIKDAGFSVSLRMMAGLGRFASGGLTKEGIDVANR
ncbi:MAG: hypothetical protein VST70_04920 [Nitrospirota bacterium]|nr:hypothetical protein [Nitrospirota bacterium]